MSSARGLQILFVGLALILSCCGGASLRAATPDEPGPYVFYGYAPPAEAADTWEKEAYLRRYNVSFTLETLIANETFVPAKLSVVGINDSTHVWVYNLSDGSLVASFTVDRMDLRTVILPPREAFLKIVSDRLVSVLLSRAQGAFSRLSTFYPSTNGGFRGGEFIFQAVGKSRFEEPVTSITLFGVEPGRAAVYDASGREVTEFDLAANDHRAVDVRTGAVYRVVSTGSILVGSFSFGEGFTYAPSLKGGFVGKEFVGTGGCFVFVALEEGEARVYGIPKPGWFAALAGPEVRRAVEAGIEWFNASAKLGVARFESTARGSVLVGSGGWDFIGNAQLSPYRYPWNLGDDIAVLGARAGEELGFYAPTQAVIFASEDVTLEIDEQSVPMKKDGYHILLRGAHRVRATGPIIVEVLGDSNIGVDWPQDWHPVVWRGYDDWATYLVSAQGLEVSYPEPHPVENAAELAAYLGGGVGAAAAAVMVAVFTLRRRRHGQR